jgi:HEAT repeat protein
MGVAREGYPDRPRDALAWAARQSPEALSRVRRLALRGLRSEDAAYRHNCAILMGDIGLGLAALAELISALGDPSVEVRIRAVEAIADLGNADPTILPALKAAANDADPGVREHAFGAIDEIELGLEIGEMLRP